MSLKNNELRIVDIDLDNDTRIPSRNSDQSDEILSHYSYTDSDLHDFQKLEKDIYGSHGDDESSVEHDMMQEFFEDATDEQTESLEFIRPHVPVRPSLGDPIDTYDQLQSNFEPVIRVENENDKILNSNQSNNKQTTNSNRNTMSPIHKSRGSSRASGGSAETVLSQSQKIDDVPLIPKVLDRSPKTRNKLSSISSVESSEKQSRKKVNNRAALRSLLDQEKATRKSQETYIEHLHQSLNQLLSQHALAKETIDQLRLGVALNINENNNRPRLRHQRYHKRPAATSNSQILSRRYSSIIGNSDIPDFDNSTMSRARSVDMNMFDEEPNNEIAERHTTTNEYGGSLKFVKKNMSENQGLSSEIANDFQLNFDKFQTRVEIIEQAIEELSSYIDGGASGSSGSQYGDLDGSNDRHQTDSENRLQNILLAYENLQKDFNQVCDVWKDTAKNYIPATKVMHNMDSKEQIEASLFQLRMQLDDLERHVKQGHQPTFINPNIDTTPFGNSNQNNNLVKRTTDLEDKYRQLMGRYNDLKRFSSPKQQKDKEEVIKLLKEVIAEANGRSSIIATPEAFDNILHQDLIESMKLHLSSDSPPYFLTEDGLSSGNSSFGKGRSKRKKISRPEENTIWKPMSHERLSPTKSRISSNSVDLNNYGSSNQFIKYDSQPVSLVSSTSGWQGATSGETLLVDERGILTDGLRNGSANKNDIFLHKSRPIENSIKKVRSYTNSVDVESIKSRPNSSGLQNLDDDVKRLDEHLARIELEEKNRTSETNANPDSDVALSRNTRSLLGTSPSNSNYSRQSKPVSSVGSSHRSNKSKQSKHNSSSHSDLRKKPKGYKFNIESTDSGEDSASYEDDLEEYVRTASCGIGPRSRYIRKKNNNVQDRWSQTPTRPLHKSHRSPAYDMNLSPEYDDAYVDDVAYWDGVAFHPAREGLPSKSILRRSSPNSKYHRKRLRQGTLPVRPLSDSYSRPPFPLPRMMNSYNEPLSLREYSTIGPHRYFVREYGHLNRIPSNQPLMLEDLEGDDYDEDDNDYSYRKHIEERRLCNYLDEAIKAARDMKEYTRRLGDICQQRQLAREPVGSYQCRNFRPLYI